MLNDYSFYFIEIIYFISIYSLLFNPDNILFCMERTRFFALSFLYKIGKIACFPLTLPPFFPNTVCDGNGKTNEDALMDIAQTNLSHPQRTYNRLSDRIRAFIEEQNYRCGDKLPPERTLAESFGVSRGSIREAIRILNEKGILRSRQGDGTYVHSPDISPLQGALLEVVDAKGEMFDQIIEFRRIVDPPIAMLAAVRCTPEQLNMLKIVVCEQHMRCLSNENDGDLDAQFHTMLAECTANPMLVNAAKTINNAYAECRASELRTPEWRKLSLNAHLRILKAIENRSPDEAHNAVMAHLETIASKHLFSVTRD